MTQLNRDDLAGMTSEAIVEAHDNGQLDQLLGTPAEDIAVLDRARSGEFITLADVRTLAGLGRHELINDAHRAGRITNGDHA
jgi:hypothetical protein